MVYISLISIVTYIGFFSLFIRRKSKGIFLLLITLLSLISMLRFGQGTDYFSYMKHYELTSARISESFFNSSSHIEIGFRFLMSIFRSLNLEFFLFTFSLSFFCWSVMGYCILKISNKPILTLAMFYGLYATIYIDSALRQGLCMVLFILALYLYLYKDNKIAYISIIILASLFHKSILITLIIIFVDQIPNNIIRKKNFYIFLIIISSLLLFTKFYVILFEAFKIFGVNINYSPDGINIFALLYRMGNLLIMSFLFRNIDKRIIPNPIKRMYLYYFIGVCVYIITSPISIFSRLSEYLILLEIFIFPQLISLVKKRKLKIITSFLVCVIIIFMFCKDQKSYIIQGNYSINKITEYPYINYFNQDKFYEYR